MITFWGFPKTQILNILIGNYKQYVCPFIIIIIIFF